MRVSVRACVCVLCGHVRLWARVWEEWMLNAVGGGERALELEGGEPVRACVVCLRCCALCGDRVRVRALRRGVRVVVASCALNGTYTRFREAGLLRSIT